MASRKTSKKSTKRKTKTRSFRPGRWFARLMLRVVGLFALLVTLAVVSFAIFNPPITYYMWNEQDRLGSIKQNWVPAEDIAPVMLRAAVAAEDANFCLHWGFDVAALRAAISRGGAHGGASTISQQVVKNVYLWHGRSYTRKALEALITPFVEGVWTKRRILEVYLNIAEFDEGVFGVDAAARHYFGVSAAGLSQTQAARLAAVLPSPKRRSASNPSSRLRHRAGQIQSGAATIQLDGRSACFEGG